MARNLQKQLTRRQLYDKVWAQPMTKIAPTLWLSDVGLAKVCRKYEIPRPPVGYWAKLAHGKHVERIELPELSNKDLSEIILFRENFDKDFSVPSRPKITVDVPEKLTRAHRYIRSSRSLLKTAQQNGNGILESPKSNCLSIDVSKKRLARALRILDAIIKAWEEGGGEVQIDPTKFCLGKDGVCVTLSETVRRFEKKPEKDRYWKDWSYEPTGILCLEVHGYGDGLRKNWRDGKVQVLENILGNFISTLHKWIEFKKAGRLDKECSERQKAKADSRRSSVKQEKEFEEARRTELMTFVESWEKAQRIRKYLDAVDETLKLKESAPSKPEAFASWLEWARWYADATCPLTKAIPRKGATEMPENCLVAELDLTSTTKKAIQKFPEKTTDELFEVSKEEFRKRCSHAHWSTYAEVTLVLEGLGYDVSQRDTRYW